jgi:hypothetical protein
MPDAGTDPLGLEALGVLLAALGLSSVSGLRAYFPLLAVAVGSHVSDGAGNHLITLSKPFQVLGTPWFVALLVLLVLGEFTVDKLPVIDHISDLIHTFVRPLSGAIIMAGVSNPLSEKNVWAAAAVGAVLSLTVHVAKATTRPVVTATTAGLGNPVVSFVEDGLTVILGVLAILAPFVAFVLLLIAAFVIGWLVYKGVRKLRAKRQPPVAGGGSWSLPGGTT